VKPVTGFSKLSKVEKIDFLIDKYFSNSKTTKEVIKSFWHNDESAQRIFDDFSENTLTNFYAPYGVVPNLQLDNKLYCIPMVIEESSVVAACAKSAKFWLERGGFHAEVISTTKVGQVHFIWNGKSEKLFEYFETIKKELLESVSSIVTNMEKRGGGVKSVELVEKTDLEPGYYQIYATFETCDAMGANFINSVLEGFGCFLQNKISNNIDFDSLEKEVQIVMCILSNYTPECLVKAWVECDIKDLDDKAHNMKPEDFVEKFSRAVRISKIDVNRATTHNKGIFNGIDALILATGNDFRAVEACGHTYAARDGQYRGLTDCEIKDGRFKFSLEIPMSLGTVGGLTSLHPMAKVSLAMMGNPSAEELMKLVASIGLAQNFAALRSLVTSGIQKGHMKMHLMNILNHLEANDEERKLAKEEFEIKAVSFNAVREYLSGLREYQ
jgi:hydroxymethylglutaryl-CoA reductase